jgi:O-antigen ligase
MAIAAPLLIAYIAVGWGRTEGIFKPVGAISTMMGKNEDSSSETRNIENYNLIMTLKSNPILGSGWGHEYDEVSVAYSIKEFFEQYRFIPHNSVLGVLAFTGLFGFTGIWQIFPVATFLLAHTYRNTNDPRVRMATLSGLVGLVVFVLQMWGDMGMGTITSDVLFGASLGVAARMPVLAGTWVKPKPSAKPGIDHEHGKDVQRHEGTEGNDGAPKPALADALAGEEKRDGEGENHHAEEEELRHRVLDPK